MWRDMEKQVFFLHKTIFRLFIVSANLGSTFLSLFFQMTSGNLFQKNPSGRKKTFYVSFLLVTNFRFVFIKAGKKCQKQLSFFCFRYYRRVKERERKRERERESESERERDSFYWSCFLRHILHNYFVSSYYPATKWPRQRL